MKPSALLPALLSCAVLCSVPSLAQEKGNWRAASSTARYVTGDLVFSGEKISINFASFPLAQIRTLKPSEIAAGFSTDAAATGNLFRLSIPAAKSFLHHNTLCGSEDTQWIATAVSGHNLQIAMFSGASMPVFTPDALASSTSLCGTYTYTR